jgi:flagellar hook protein FlgE
VQLVDLLAAQRAYQANSQVIKAQDQALQTITSLR